MDRGPILEGEEHPREEERDLRISSFFIGVVQYFPANLESSLKGFGKYGEEEKEESECTEVFPDSVGEPGGTRRLPAFKNPSMKAPDLFHGTKLLK
ncbi:hypothetical protein O181_029627 [Austropuccinia psidii MF-1]|uniref:Uncharacterized protein n=1 Tax=Austropuccinia psidii MF-1 TaxID=1389203 RepID=A0A9Q3H3P3_9BASI|nr:hypothetical protein [Austropuccinia psidii MF-1]